MEPEFNYQSAPYGFAIVLTDSVHVLTNVFVTC